MVVDGIVQNIFCLYDVTSFTQILHSIPVATKCNIHLVAREIECHTVSLIYSGSASKVAV